VRDSAAGFAVLYLIVGIPLLVLPRLYGMSRRRVFAAQLAAGFAALTALVLMIAAVQAITGART
jgi:hypothetical protein